MNYVTFDTEDGQEFLKAVTNLRNSDKVAEFFSDLFTPSEARTFVSRWKAALLLYKKVPYIEIQKETGLSSATVARVSQALQYGTGGLQRILERLQPKR